MPPKRNRKDSESSNCCVSGLLEEVDGVSDSLPSNDFSDSARTADPDGVEVAWLRPCCTPLGCILGGRVNLTEPDEIEKIVCSNDTCPAGPYMHKECFGRWEDGLLTYLRSHGRARSWSEKQRKQNLWTKRGYDLAYRACACICARGHLRKDLNWDPKDVNLPCDPLKKVSTEESTKKKNRKKHKDLPVLGNKYTFGVAKSKSKAIPTRYGVANNNNNNRCCHKLTQILCNIWNSRDSRVRTSSTSSVLSVDQGYSSSSPSNSEIHGSLGNGALFSPPQNGRSNMLSGHRVHAGFRSASSHGIINAFSHAALPEIPDNDILHDFCGSMTQFSSYRENDQAVFPFSRFEFKGPDGTSTSLRVHEGTTQSHANVNPLAGQCPQGQQLPEVSKMMSNIAISQMQQPEAWNILQQTPFGLDVQSPPDRVFDLNLMTSNAEALMKPCHGEENKSPLQGMQPSYPVPLNNVASPLSSFGSTWNQQMYQTPPFENKDNLILSPCQSSNNAPEKHPPFPDFTENVSTMFCSDIDLKKPKVIIIPRDTNSSCEGAACTEISITPMCSTLFHKRYDFKAFEIVLKPHQVNPYHIKMEGEGYGSDDFRNSVLAKLSRAKRSQMNCITCGKVLLIYSHFPLLDGTMFLSPLKNMDQPQNDLRIEMEKKSDYLHAVCISCLDGVNNVICRMCECHWRAPFHQLGSLYMYDVFAASPCCQSRLCCKQCGIAIIDRRVGLKYYSEYSKKVTCPSCGTVDYHFVHQATTFKVLGPDKFFHF